MYINQKSDSPDINKLIDERSRQIWEHLINCYEISLTFHDEPNYKFFGKGKTAIFFITKGFYDKDYFAHEILHLHLTARNINIGSYLKLRFQENGLLSSIFSAPLLEHISNILDHAKMLPMYLNMGFDRNKFIVDYDEPKCTERELNLIRLFINSKSNLWKNSVDLFLGKYFSIKSCPNDKIDYTAHLDQLCKIDGILFEILDHFWGEWMKFDICKVDLPGYTYWDFCDTFYDSVNAWALEKTHTC